MNGVRVGFSRSAMLARRLSVGAIRLLICGRRHDDGSVLPNDPGLTVVTVIPIEELRRSAMSALFEGGADAPISFFVTEFPRGRGPDLHLHPYPDRAPRRHGAEH